MFWKFQTMAEKQRLVQSSALVQLNDKVTRKTLRLMILHLERNREQVLRSAFSTIHQLPKRRRASPRARRSITPKRATASITPKRSQVKQSSIKRADAKTISPVPSPTKSDTQVKTKKTKTVAFGRNTTTVVPPNLFPTISPPQLSARKQGSRSSVTHFVAGPVLSEPRNASKTKKKA